MAESRLFKAWGQGCARSLVLRIAIAVPLTAGFVCLAVAAALAPIDQDYKMFVWIGLLLIFLFVVIGGVIVWAVWAVRGRAAELDLAFGPLGLDGRMYLQNGRQYHGVYRGRQVHAYFYRGPTLQIYIDVPFKTRVGIGRRGALERLAADMLDRESLPVNDPDFEHLVVYPLDPNWAQKLLASSDARAAILRLTTEDAAAELRSLSIAPEALVLQAHHIPLKNITPQRCGNGWTISSSCPRSQKAWGLPR